MPAPSPAHGSSTPGRRRARGLGWALVVGLGLGACFDGDYLAYAPCESSEPCHEAGMIGCMRIAAGDPGDPSDGAAALGFCAPACAQPCPTPATGDAPAICITQDEARVCVLSCGGDVTCPDGMACHRVQDQGQAYRDLCFPEGA